MTSIFVDNSEMAGRINAHDWARTPVGPIENWPPCLRIQAGVVLANLFPSVLLWGADFTVCAYNDAYRRVLGRKREALGRPFLDVWPEARATIRPQIEQALRGEACSFRDAPFTLERFDAPDRAYFDYCFSPVRDESGSVKGVLNTAVETTERKRTEAALRASEAAERARGAELAALVEAIPSPVWFTYDAECEVVTGNRAAKEMLGVAEDRRNLSLATPGGTRPPFEVWRDGVRLSPDQLTMRRAIAIRARVDGDEMRIVRPDGSVRWAYGNAVPLFADDGAVRGCVCVSMDVTRLKETEAALKESERKYRKLFEIESDALFLVDVEAMRILDANASAVALYGYAKAELLALSPADISAEPEKTRDGIARESCRAALVWHRKKDGTVFPVEITAAHFDMGGKRVELAAMRDITERQAAEAEIAEKTGHLTEVNAALKALLRQRDEDRREFEETVTTNLKHLVAPYLERLKKTRLSANQAGWVDIVEGQLNRVTSRFARRVTLRELSISNAELRVASLVRDGRTTKEIADILLISEKTVSSHRDSIRRKLGLRGKKGGLRYLLLNLRDSAPRPIDDFRR